MVSRPSLAARRGTKTPRPFTPAGAFCWRLVADVHETQAAPGLDVLVAIAADVEGRAAVEMGVTEVLAVSMSVTVAVMAVAVTMAVLAARRGGGHGDSAERDRGDDE